MTIKSYNFYSVEKYLMSNTYYVPDYQREYSWVKDEQIQDFWVDLLDLIENERDNHFFGQIVVHEDMETRRKYIIDGQQRSSTSVIFMAVMLKLFDEIYNETGKEAARNKVEDIRIRIIGRWSEEENDLKFHMGKVDNEFFRTHIQRNKPFEQEVVEDSHKRIKEAYKFFYDELSEQLNAVDGAEKYSLLLKYYNAFKDNFSVMYVETDDMNEAFIIFETLNARGKALETADLLKNHLFKTSSSQIEDVKNKWLQIQNNAEGIDLTKFIRTYWNSQYPFTREKDLYKKLKDVVARPKDCVDFVEALLSSLDLYKVLKDPEDETYFNSKTIEKHILNLNIFGASTYFPVVLAMNSKNYEESDIKQVLAAIESFIFRNCIIAGKVANKYELLFAKVAQEISQKQLDVAQILDMLKPEMLTDEEFKNYFAVAEIKKSPVAKLVLRKIADHQQKEVIINPNNKDVHLEHIMPKKLGEWKISEELHQKYLNRIGNLTLLADEYNTSIKNKLIKEKSATYQVSKIEMTKSLANLDDWTVSRIEERQLELYKVAKDVWPMF